MKIRFALCAIASALFAQASELPQPGQDRVSICYQSLHTLPVDTAPCLQAADQSDALTAAEHARVHSAAAVQFARQGNRTQAVTYLNLATGFAPNDWVVLANQGVVMLYQQDYGTALNALDQAMQVRGGDEPALYLNRSLALRGAGDYEAASRDYEIYLQLTGHQAPVENFSR